MRLVALMPLWQRPILAASALRVLNLSRRCLDFDLVRLAVGSEGATSRRLAERHGWGYVEAPNFPIGQKFNHGLATARALGAEGVVFCDSAGWINAPALAAVRDRLLQGSPAVGFRDCYFVDVATRRAAHFEGYVDERHGRPIGIGRAFRRDFLDSLGWRLLDDDLIPPGIDWNMDTRVPSWNLIAQGDCGGRLVDFKDAGGLCSFDYAAAGSRPVDISTAIERFPVEEAAAVLGS